MFRLKFDFLRLILKQSVNEFKFNKISLQQFPIKSRLENVDQFKRLLHISSAKYKKRGQFVQVDSDKPAANQQEVIKQPNDKSIQDTDSASDDTKKPKVKLYPGFQASTEELKDEISSQKNSPQDPNVYVRKIIEDFYGFNELEYDGEEKDETQEDLELYAGHTEFDIDLATKALNKENVKDLCCIQIPKEMNYADHMIIGTCLSDKHLNATFISINRKYKAFKQENMQYLKRKSGKESKWCAIDAGKVVIHLFLQEYREFYDLESLWACGIEYDEKYIEFVKQQNDNEKLLVIEEDEENTHKIEKK